MNAERLLANKGVTEIDKIRIDLDPSQRSVMMEKRDVVPCHKFILASNTLVALMICERWMWQVNLKPYCKAKIC